MSELTAPPLTPLQKQRNKLLFGVQRSARYHARRCQFFDQIGNTAKFLVVISGGATVSLSLSPEPSHRVATVVFGSLVAFFAAIDLILNCAKTAREHNDLAREFLGLQRQIILAGDEFDAKTLSGLIGQRLEIEEKEPPKKRVLDILCHNELIKATGKDPGHLVKVGKFQRLVADIFDFLPDGLEKSMHSKPAPAKE